MSSLNCPPSDSFSQGSSTYESTKESADYLLNGTEHKPKIGLICGTGWGDLAHGMTDVISFPYKDVPNFPVSTVEGHAGRVLFGLLGGVPLIVMQGRFHVYEGYPVWKCGYPVRVMKLIGVEKLIVTNAAGGLNEDYKVGDIMIIRDHINMQGFAGDSPLRGKNDERFGPRFIAMNNAYNRVYRQVALKTADEHGFSKILKEGVYVMCGGPMFETVAELVFLKKLGVDAVGMSTVPEVLVARHCDIQVFAFSLITNECIVHYDTDEITHCDIIEVIKRTMKEMQQLVKTMVTHMHNP